MAIFLIVIGVVFLFASLSAVVLWRQEAILDLKDRHQKRLAGRPRWLKLIMMPDWQLRLYSQQLDDSLTVLFARLRLIGLFLMGTAALVAGIITAID